MDGQAKTATESQRHAEKGDKGAYYFHVDCLSVGYGGVPLVRDIEIRLEKGEIFTMLGPNGAGKSTILKTVTQQLARISGTVVLDGCDIYEADKKNLARRLAVLLTQRVNPELMTCEDIVGTGRYPYTGSLGLLTDEDRAIVRDAMELVSITELRDRDFNAISDGQRQRVMLARALAQQPELLVLDEPTSYLDIRYKLELLNILQRMSRERDMTVVMSLHELELAQRVSDKIMTIKGHTVDRIGPPEEIFTPGYIGELYRIDAGSYDEASGRVELPRVDGKPQAFVVAGAGSGTRLYRRLQREGVPFATGVLMENDLDFPVAKALAADVVSVPAFEKIDEGSVARAIELIDSCERVYAPCCADSTLARPLQGLIDHARQGGKLAL